MAIFGIAKNENIELLVSGVTFLANRIKSTERQRMANANQKQGNIQDRIIMDKLLASHLVDYLPVTEDPETWIIHEHEFVSREDFQNAKFRGMLIDAWPENTKVDIYNLLHENESGQDLRVLAENGHDRLGNSRHGSVVATSHEG